MKKRTVQNLYTSMTEECISIGICVYVNCGSDKYYTI